MSAGGQGGAGRREVAYRLFAAEYEDAELEHSDSDEERAPNYVVTPTGARVNRLFVVGVLTEVEPVSEGVLRARIVDPTGAFVCYAGQYQPDAQTFLERADPPAFVAVTGKARTFRPEDGDRVFTSIRPESINEVDAATRDRWVVQAAAHTTDRVATFAAALDRPERGDDLSEALLAAGVDDGLAAGIPLAIDGYGTTPAYLAAVRDMAVQAVEVVAGEREEVAPLDLAPDEGGPADRDLAGELAEPVATATPGGDLPSGGTDVDTPGTEPAAGSAGGDAGAVDADGEVDHQAVGAADEADGAVETSEEEVAVDEPVDPTASTEDVASTADAGGGAADEGASGAGTTPDEEDDLGDFDDFGVEHDGSAGSDAETDTDGAAGADELYELDEEEREAIEEEYGTEFTAGTEVDEPGEADIETPTPDSTAEAAEAEAEPVADESGDQSEERAGAAAESEPGATPALAPESEPGAAAGGAAEESEEDVEPRDVAEGEEATVPEVEPETGGVEEPEGVEEVEAGEGTEEEPEAAEDEGGDVEEGDVEGGEAAPEADAVDLEDATMEAMQDLDAGDGADRAAVIQAVTQEYGVAADAVEEAIQDALMSGRCYEPEDGTLKAI